MSDPSLIVVRGAYRGTDPTYACTAHDVQKGRYALLEVQDGRVTKRTLVPASDRAVVEEAMQHYRGVTVDARDDAALVSKLKAPAHAVQADEAFFAGLRRAKSDEELQALTDLHAATRERLDAEAVTTSTFRGVAQKEGHKSAFEVTKARGFTQYRGGLQDAKGRVSDMTRVVARTPEWEERMERVERGFRAAEKQLCIGARIKDLDDAFMQELDRDKDYVYGSVVHHTGYESHETSVPLDTIQRYDFHVLGAAVSDGSETALVYRSGHAFGDDHEAKYGALYAAAAPDETAYGDAQEDEDMQAAFRSTELLQPRIERLRAARAALDGALPSYRKAELHELDAALQTVNAAPDESAILRAEDAERAVTVRLLQAQPVQEDKYQGLTELQRAQLELCM